MPFLKIKITSFNGQHQNGGGARNRFIGILCFFHLIFFSLFCFLRWGISMLPRLVLNTPSSSCLSYPSTWDCNRCEPPCLAHLLGVLFFGFFLSTGGWAWAQVAQVFNYWASYIPDLFGDKALQTCSGCLRTCGTLPQTPEQLVLQAWTTIPSPDFLI